MDYYSAFPFYMGYQGYGQWAQPGIVPEDRILEDLEYLQQMYPTYARKYQNAISSVVDKMDYEGSFIYDQYPDKLTLQRMVESVMAIIKTNEEAMGNINTGMQQDNAIPGNTMALQSMSENTAPNIPGQSVTGSNMIDKALTEQAPWREKEPWIRELVTVLMCYEILTRRRKKNRQWFGTMSSNRYNQY
ncbi:MAG: hypothetical protein K2N95_02935 [Lachnospiraceae bacterium]|nr:hypothetical protein [Lachnospiraceae bacterium]